MNDETQVVNTTSQEDTEGVPATTSTDTEAKPDVVSLDEHKKVKNEAQNLRQRLRDTEARLQHLEDANKTEQERLQEKATRATQLETDLKTKEEEITSLRAALEEEVQAQAKSLPKELSDLMPTGSPVEQLAWIRKARGAADKLKPQNGLPPAGERNPSGNGKKDGFTKEDQERNSRLYANRW